MESCDYFPNYFSIDDIFVTQEKVPCRIQKTITGMGFLDSGSQTENLEQGKQVNLPLWYLKELKQGHLYLAVQVPEIYSNVHKAVCEAGATEIELGKLHSHFYEFGCCLIAYDETNIIGRIVFETCRSRLRYLIDAASNTTSSNQHKLERVETKLSQVCGRTNVLFNDWLRQKSSIIETSMLVTNYNNKRKRAALDDDEVLQAAKKK